MRQTDLATYVEALEDALRDAAIREAKQEAILRDIERQRDAAQAALRCDMTPG